MLSTAHDVLDLLASYLANTLQTCLPCPLPGVSPAPSPSLPSETPVDAGDPTTNAKTATLPASGTGGREGGRAATCQH